MVPISNRTATLLLTSVAPAWEEEGLPPLQQAFITRREPPPSSLVNLGPPGSSMTLPRTPLGTVRIPISSRLTRFRPLNSSSLLRLLPPPPEVLRVLEPTVPTVMPVVRRRRRRSITSRRRRRRRQVRRQTRTGPTAHQANASGALRKVSSNGSRIACACATDRNRPSGARSSIMLSAPSSSTCARPICPLRASWLGCGSNAPLFNRQHPPARLWRFGQRSSGQ
mmetsp:Transcript_5089/g.10195  ORF Transcript_5089/g.10195 Transcript_5089/m.10195 type:complete len:224 (-) Transcript_5089:1046-1717(-)